MEIKCGTTKRQRGPYGVWILRGIKLLEHAMKVVERIFEHRIRQQIETDDMQMGLMKGKGTTEWQDRCRIILELKVKKGKVFPYSLPSVGPGADPGVQAVSRR